VLAGLEKDADCRDVVEVLLKEIPEFQRVSVKDFWVRRLVDRWGWSRKDGGFVV
jgi:hypothetical protein